MSVHPASAVPPAVNRVLRLLLALAIALLVLPLAPGLQEASAIAPPLATTLFATEARANPGYDDPAIAVIPAGTELELTGEAAPGFLAVYYDGEVVWVPGQYLSLGTRPGIDTAVAIEETPLLDAPLADAAVLGIVPEGETVILTGANVDGYYAGSYKRTGGWLDGRDLDR